jgi:hypothetical protein
MAHRPDARVNPRTDPDFVALVDSLVAVVADPAELQARLRQTHPLTVVRERGLSGEPVAVWYVYRDGRWVDP